jgi:hypothetical protein
MNEVLSYVLTFAAGALADHFLEAKIRAAIAPTVSKVEAVAARIEDTADRVESAVKQTPPAPPTA